MKRSLLMMLAVFLLVRVAGAAPVTVDLWENFPNSQGEDGFYAYAYQYGGAVYRLLDRIGDYAFGTPAKLQYPLGVPGLLPLDRDASLPGSSFCKIHSHRRTRCRLGGRLRIITMISPGNSRDTSRLAGAT